MSVITDTTHRPAPMPPPARRRLLWAALAFTLGAVSGAGITLAVDDAPSRAADVGTIVSSAGRQSTASATDTPSGSPDAIERAAQLRQQAKAADCARQPASADAVERCSTAGG